MRLIDADKLKKHYAWWHQPGGIANPELKGYAETFDEVIDEQPTVDPVKHGRWEDCSNGWMCSVCKHDARKDYPYCPNCGAKMDEEEE